MTAYLDLLITPSTRKMIIQDFDEGHKETADKILSCNSSDLARILGLEELINEKDARLAFESLSSLLVPECRLKLYERAQEAHDCKQYLFVLGPTNALSHYGVDMTEYFGNNYAPPLFITEHGSRSTMRGNVNPCFYCDQPKGFLSSKTKDYFFQMMKYHIDRVLQCDPNDFVQVLELKNDYDQIELDTHFWGMATWVSPFVTPYWEAGEFSERQKKAFKSRLARVNFWYPIN